MKRPESVGTRALAGPAALTDRVPRERLAELVSAASYGSVLVLAAISVIGVSDVALGHSAEIVAGVGAATWVAHLFAELLGGHVRHSEPLRRDEIVRALVDGSPILAATVLPAIALVLGRVDVISDRAARVVAIVIGIVQLLLIGAFVGWAAPGRRTGVWIFAAGTAAVGAVVVVLTVWLGH